MKPTAKAVALVASFTLAGCAAPTVATGPGIGQPTPVVQGIWLRTDGRSGRDDPAIARQFDVDKAACNAGTEPDRNCMAARGYILVPETEVEMKAAELRAAAGIQ